MTHIASWKKDLVKSLADDIIAKPIVAVVGMGGIAGQQIQSMRSGLRKHAVLRMTRNNLAFLALNEAEKEKPGLDKLKSAIYGQCAIIVTDLNPFKLFRQLESAKTAAPAKAGQIAPIDIIVHQGPTPFGPGPIIGELQKLGLPTSIESGKIVVKKDTTLVKAGHPVPANVAAMLPKLEILPMIIGLDLRAVYENGIVYSRDVLDIPDDYYVNAFATAASSARALGVAICFPTNETIAPLIIKAFRESVGLSVSIALPTKDNIKMLLSRADAQMLRIAFAAGYTSDSIATRSNTAVVIETTPTEEKKTEVSVEEEQVSEEEAAAGLSALFG
ncbi:MAG: 50S ribosomal protein L10 [archaeon]|nr:50S ribosomal protein L10 [archaeon]